MCHCSIKRINYYLILLIKILYKLYKKLLEKIVATEELLPLKIERNLGIFLSKTKLNFSLAYEVLILI